MYGQEGNYECLQRKNSCISIMTAICSWKPTIYAEFCKLFQTHEYYYVIGFVEGGRASLGAGDRSMM